jgi:autoinducer 2-degrading protein
MALSNANTVILKLPEVLQLLKQVRELSSCEPGCVCYRVNQTIEDPFKIVLYEEYQNEDARNYHRESSHFQEIIMQQVLPLLQSRKVTILKSVV